MPKLIDDQTLEERYVEHSVLAALYVKSINTARGTEIFVNEAAIYLTVKSAYDDVERYKKYHLENPHDQKSNSVKRVAYLTKWLMKLRPLQPQPKPNDKEITPLLVNASFCLAVARAHISAELCKEFALTLHKEYEITYDLTYREMNGDALLAMYQHIYDTARGVPLLENIADHDFK